MKDNNLPTVWTTQKGVKINIADMSTPHIGHAIDMLMRVQFRLEDEIGEACLVANEENVSRQDYLYLSSLTTTNKSRLTRIKKYLKALNKEYKTRDLSEGV